MQKIQPLLKPFTLGVIKNGTQLTLPNRCVVASLTRRRSKLDTHAANDLHIDYYAARASAGLIQSEASAINETCNSFPGGASIFTDVQVEGWKRVTEAVHEKGGRIFHQAWHGGRTVHPNHIGGQ